MTAYLALVLAVGPWPGTHGVPASAHVLARDASLSGFAIAAFLSWRVTRGSALARGLIMAWTVFGFAAAFFSVSLRSGSVVPVWLLVGEAGQIALLLSQPVYERTRKDPAAPYPSPTSLWPAPPRWMLAAAPAAAAVGALLGLGSMGPPPDSGCSRGQLGSSCMTISQGFPVHFLNASPVVSLQDGFRPFLSSLAGAAISRGALAEDLALWTLAAFVSMYLLWIASRRPEPGPSAEGVVAPEGLPSC